jgi:hypothetical protein
MLPHLTFAKLFKVGLKTPGYVIRTAWFRCNHHHDLLDLES